MLWAHTRHCEGKMYFQDVWMWTTIKDRMVEVDVEFRDSFWAFISAFHLIFLEMAVELVKKWILAADPGPYFISKYPWKSQHIFIFLLELDIFRETQDISRELSETIYCILLVSVVLFLLDLSFMSYCGKQVALLKMLSSQSICHTLAQKITSLISSHSFQPGSYLRVVSV